MGWRSMVIKFGRDTLYDFQDDCSHHFAKKADATLSWDICRQIMRQRSRLRTVKITAKNFFVQLLQRYLAMDTVSVWLEHELSILSTTGHIPTQWS